VQRLLVAAEVDERGLEAGDEQRGGRILWQCRHFIVTAREGIAALAFEHAADVGKRAAREDAFAARQVLEEGARERGAVLVADGGLHREHGRDATAQQQLGEAGGLRLAGGAMAGVQEYQRSGPLRPAQRLEQVPRGRLDRVALFIVELEAAGLAMAGDIEDVVLVALERVVDRVRIARLQDADLDVVVALGRLDGVEDVLQLPLVIEHVVCGLALIRRTDRDQD
jgi:hypothetical protein